MPSHRHGSRSSADPIRITSVGTSHAEEMAGRQRRYLISMGIRSACFVGAVIAGVAGINWLWPILVVGALLLPYVAVVLANAPDERSKSGLVPSPGTHRELGQHEDRS